MKKSILLIAMLVVGLSSQCAWSTNYTGGFTELQNAINDLAASNTFTANQAVVVTSSLPWQQGAQLTINGANAYSITSSGLYSGFTTPGGKTLTINDVTAITLNAEAYFSSAVESSGVLNISNTDFVDNYGWGDGGAIHNTSNGTLNISNGSTFTGNGIDATDTVITSNGGAIYNATFDATISTIANTTFQDNAAILGGAIYNNSGILEISNTDFVGNYTEGDGYEPTGGAIFNSAATLRISNSSFDENHTSGPNTYGGAIANSGILEISNTDFDGNYTGASSYGGAIYNSGTMSISNGSTFTGNGLNSLGQISTSVGGAISNMSPEATTSTISDSTFLENAAAIGGAIGNTSGILEISNTDFVGNYTATMSEGGAIYNETYGTLNISNGSTFTGNGINTLGTVVTRYGGAISNYGLTTIANTDFTGNKATYYGGAIYNTLSAATMTISDSTFQDNASVRSGGAIYNNQGILDISNTDFDGNYAGAGYNGGAIYNQNGTLRISSGSTFTGNGINTAGTVVTQMGGAIYNNLSAATMTISDSTFQDNASVRSGGAIYNSQGILEISNTDFDGNYAGTTYTGGAIYNGTNGTLRVSSGSTFTENGIDTVGVVKTTSGGAIYNNSLAATISTISDSTFQENATISGGGAIYNNQGILEISSTDFVGNYAGASGRGGAIYNSTNGTLRISSGSTFTGNGIDSTDTIVTMQGGAIVNISALATISTISDSTFQENAAISGGGAIYNESGILEISNTDFVGNYAQTNGSGGAIYNTPNGTLRISNGSTFTGNGIDTVGVVKTTNGGAILNNSLATISNTDFIGNKAGNKGGAIYNDSSVATISTISGSTFQENRANLGGAIYNNSGILEISSTDFVGNYNGNTGGAIYNNTNGTLRISSGSTFTGNGIDTTDTVVASQGGAIYNDSSAATISTIADSTFQENSAITDGGAIHNASGILEISSTDFVGNYAGAGSYGGAIYNDINGTLRISNGSTFTGNGFDTTGTVVTMTGGAIYNSTLADTISTISDSTFQENAVNGGAGGAICSESGILEISNTDFVGNYGINAHGSAGAIYILGTLRISNGSTFTGNGINTLGTVVVNYGGAIVIETSDSSTISDSTFQGNAAIQNGGAITAWGILEISNTDFVGNYTTNVANSYGGAILNSANLTISNGSTFTGNGINTAGTVTTRNGGAIYNMAGNLEISNSVFQENATVRDGGAIYNTATLETANTDFVGNYAGTGYGGGAIYNGMNGRLRISSGSTFTGNGINTLGVVKTTNGGAIYNDSSAATISTIADSTFEENAAIQNGGAIYNIQGILEISSSDFVGNYSTNIGGAIYNAVTLRISSGSTFTGNGIDSLGNVVTTYGGAIYNDSLAATISTISDSTFQENSASFGGAIYNNQGILEISNTDFIDNYSNGNGGAIQNNDTLRISNGSTFTGNGIDTLGQVVTNAGGAIYNNSALATISTISDSTFEGNAAGEGGAIQNISGILEISNTDFVGNYSTNIGGAIYNSPNGTLRISNGSTFTGNGIDTLDAIITNNGGAIFNSGLATISNTDFTGNKATVNGGAIYNTGTLSIIADGANTSFANNNDSTGLNDIYLQSGSTLNLNVKDGNTITFSSGINSADTTANVNINKSGILNTDGITPAPTNGEVVLNSAIKNSSVNLYAGKLTLTADNYLDNNALTLAGGTLNMINNTIGTMALNALTIANGTTTNLNIDTDLAAGTSDIIKLNGGGTYSGTGTLNLHTINLLSDSTTNSTTTAFIDSTLINHVTVNMGVTKAYSPIYTYEVTYDNSTGSLKFAGGPSGGGNFNPAVMSSAVSANVGAYMSQVGIYSEALSRAEIFMSLPQSERLLMKQRNLYANVGGNDVQPEVFSPTFLPEEKGGIWFKQYTTFENVPMNNGPNVSNIGYGALVGGDTPLTYLGHGFDGYLTVYAGYNGSNQNYGNVGANQNGGALGVTGTIYKGNLFSALTASVGDSVGQARTIYGVDNFNTILAGLAWKTGYNIEMAKGKLILQPSLLASYTFANTFDYTTASGVDITSDPLNAIQVAPGVKLIANLENGWQPYLGTNMVWNIMDAQKFYANNAMLPQLSVAPYIEYGLGVQRRWKERFSGFGQFMLRGGGRNGIALQFGLRMAI